MEQLTLKPIQHVQGTVNVPGSKSLSNRALLLAALAEGQTHLTNLLDSDDIRHMLNALTKLGVTYRLSECKTQCWVTGNGGAFKVTEPVELYLGNAGTAVRPLCAVLAASQGEFTLTGEPRMEERPIAPLIDALTAAGADIQCHKNPGFVPMTIRGTAIDGNALQIDGTLSSQFLTALLMAAPLLDQQVNIEINGELVSKPYIDITLDTMQKFGVEVVNHNYQRFEVAKGQRYRAPEQFLVEGDASSASYFLAAGAIKGGPVRVTGVGKQSIQGDIRFADALQAMGAEVIWGNDFIEVRGGSLRGIDMDFNHIPDAAMTIATTALFAKGQTRLTNIYTWRLKETDRIAAMATELKKVGAHIEEGEDYLVVTPPEQLQHAEIDTYNDHRMAMCFSLVALSDTPVTINDPGCTAKTFPDFFQRLQSISHT